MPPVLSGLRVRATGDMRSIALHGCDYCALISLIVHFGKWLMLYSVVNTAHMGAFFEFLREGGVLLKYTAVVVLRGQQDLLKKLSRDVLMVRIVAHCGQLVSI